MEMVTIKGVTRPAVKPTLKWCKMTARKGVRTRARVVRIIQLVDASDGT